MHASAAIDTNTVVVPTDSTRQRAVAIESTMADYLRQKRGRKNALKLLSADGEMCDLPDQLADLLAQLAAIMARGDAVVVNALSRELSTTEAAVLLGMSRPTLIRLLETGAIAHRKVGTHRRVDLKQVLDYRRKRLDQQRKAYAELMRENDALGIVE